MNNHHYGRRNYDWMPLSEIRERYRDYYRSLSLQEQLEDTTIRQMDAILLDERYPAIAHIIHPLTIRGYRVTTVKHTDKKPYVLPLVSADNLLARLRRDSRNVKPVYVVETDSILDRMYRQLEAEDGSIEVERYVRGKALLLIWPDDYTLHKTWIVNGGQYDMPVDALLDCFHESFGAYPRSIVSHGSLADAALSASLCRDDYDALSWQWLVANHWKDTDVRPIEGLLADAYSAGYVDQFALGYVGDAWMADVNSAYPSAVRRLPDLRYSSIHYGTGNLDEDIQALREQGLIVWTAIIRGVCFIPSSLPFHPITIKTEQQSNIRPTGGFCAGYTYAEREYCRQHGASFAQEEYAIVALSKLEVSSLAKVSQSLGEGRYEAIEQRQYGKGSLYKIIDNALYGKMMQLTEYRRNGKVEGYWAGERFNLLYGVVVTASVRISIASAMREIARNGGEVLLAMTDSIYWRGNADMLPSALSRQSKYAGYFSRPVAIEELYILKTGLYEYKANGYWRFKTSGITLFSKPDNSLLRDAVKRHCKTLTGCEDPRGIEIPFMESSIRPFKLNSKIIMRDDFQFLDCLDGYIGFAPRVLILGSPGSHNAAPRDYLRKLDEQRRELRRRKRAARHAARKGTDEYKAKNAAKTNVTRALKMDFIYKASALTGISPDGLMKPLQNNSWANLEQYFGIKKGDVQ